MEIDDVTPHLFVAIPGAPGEDRSAVVRTSKQQRLTLAIVIHSITTLATH